MKNHDHPKFRLRVLPKTLPVRQFLLLSLSFVSPSPLFSPFFFLSFLGEKVAVGELSMPMANTPAAVAAARDATQKQPDVPSNSPESALRSCRAIRMS